MSIDPDSSESSPRGNREDAKRKTREALLRAATAEFLSKGFDVPSLDAICARAGYTRGAFYVHFKDRDDLLAAVMERLVGDVIDASLGSDDATMDYRTVVRNFVHVAAGWAEEANDARAEARAAKGHELVRFHQMIEACVRAPRVRERMVNGLGDTIDRLTSMLEAGQDAGTLRTDVAPHSIASLMLLQALGARVAAEIGLETDVIRSPDAALCLFATPLSSEPGEDS